jgi:ABC-type phosphate transport system permease subunit
VDLVLLCSICDEFIGASDEEGLIERLLTLDGLGTTETETIRPITMKQRKRAVAKVMVLRAGRPRQDR